jgi:hypothetical protein
VQLHLRHIGNSTIVRLSNANNGDATVIGWHIEMLLRLCDVAWIFGLIRLYYLMVSIASIAGMLLAEFAC